MTRQQLEERCFRMEQRVRDIEGARAMAYDLVRSMDKAFHDATSDLADARRALFDAQDKKDIEPCT